PGPWPPPGINRYDDSLRAEGPRAFVDDGRLFDRRRVDRNFIRARSQHSPHVFDGANAAAYSERDEDRVGDATRHLINEFAAVARRRDVEKDQLIRAFAVVAPRLLYGIARVNQINEANPFDDA